MFLMLIFYNVGKQYLLQILNTVGFQDTDCSFEPYEIFLCHTFCAVRAIRYWTSLHVRQGCTSNMRAIRPAAIGAAALVPVWCLVQPDLSAPRPSVQSVVTCTKYPECKISWLLPRKVSKFFKLITPIHNIKNLKSITFLHEEQAQS